MVLKEVGIQAHGYLLIACGLTFAFFIIYGFIFDHKNSITNDKNWVDAFSKVGIAPSKMTHDGDMWYYNKISTCVGYGDWEDECPRHEAFCAGGKTMGDRNSQIKAILEALKNGGQHPKCPLIYIGAN